MKIVKLVSQTLLGEYKFEQSNNHQWNLKKESNKIWQHFHFGFLLLSGIAHAIGAIAIIPPIYNLLLTRIHMMQISANFSIACAVMFACATVLECWIELIKNRSTIMKVLALFCLYCSFIFVHSSILLRKQIRTTLEGLEHWILAGRLFGYGRAGRLVVMTKFDLINSLIFSPSLQVHFQAIMALIGMIELYTAKTFLSYAEKYEYFYYGVTLNLCTSMIRIGAALLIHRQYHPKKQQFRQLEDLNNSVDSI